MGNFKERAADVETSEKLGSSELKAVIRGLQEKIYMTECKGYEEFSFRRSDENISTAFAIDIGPCFEDGVNTCTVVLVSRFTDGTYMTRYFDRFGPNNGFSELNSMNFGSGYIVGSIDEVIDGLLEDIVESAKGMNPDFEPDFLFIDGYHPGTPTVR